jgi:hypothetical protein
MHLLLMTTTDMRSDRKADFARMIASVADSVPRGSTVHHIMLLQRSTEQQRVATAAAIPYPATVLAIADRVSLSAARNVMLAHARESGLLQPNTLVGFPDDDCWYTPGFLSELVAEFERSTDLGLLITRVSLTPSPTWHREKMRPATSTDVLRRSTSNSIFLRGDAVIAIGDFDPSLGLGTPNVSGEDTDYALRAFFQSAQTVYVDLDMVGHREPDLESVTKYFGGNMLVASRYALRSPMLFLEYVRKFAVGGYLVMRRRLRMGDFITAIQGSVGAFGRSAG